MFNDEKIMAAAKKLGLELEFDSKNPGLFFRNDSHQIGDSFSYDEINNIFSGKMQKSKAGGSAVVLEDKIEIKKDLQTRDVSLFKKQLNYKNDYSVNEGKNIDSINYNDSFNTGVLLKTYIGNNKDKAA